MVKKWLRFHNLVERGLVRSWPALRRKIQSQGFPPGVMIGPNSRAWDEAEIEAFEASRPTVGPGPKGAARRGYPRKNRPSLSQAAQQLSD
jgi:predicted DNA-binding transcriptional regulator AlpA